VARGCLAVLAVTIALIAFGLNILDRGMCGNDICHEFPSPGGKQRLVIFQRDCGATTYWSVQAQVLGHGAELPNESGLLLLRHGACLGRDAELPSVGVRWKDDQHLTLTFPGLAASEVTLDGVHITTATGAAK
jgi:hypothetical protein